jgi:CheY-like chemotaxis protein
MNLPRPNELPEYRHPLQRFRRLMPHRVRKLLLVASRYDSFLLEEDGRLNDLILTEFVDLNLGTTPWITRVSSGEQALSTALKRPFDLVILTQHLRDMDALEFAARLHQRKPGIPIVPLAFDYRELEGFRNSADAAKFERPFLWQGDFGILLGIVQSLEDRWNVAHDTRRVGVSSIILIEDSVRYYSSFLPMAYAELNAQSQLVISEGVNLQNKVMRMRARPKILHCINYEEALDFYQRYQRYILGIISDITFPRDGEPVRNAGLDFAGMVRKNDPDLPIMLQTRDLDLAEEARQVQAALVLKGSGLLLHDLSTFMRDNFGFGDFVFLNEDGTEAGRARDLVGLERLISSVGDTSILRHAERNHFSTWLRARTEFSLAEDLRWRKASDFESMAELRVFLIESLQRFRRERQIGIVSTFDPQTFQPTTSFARIGMGSLGGKARGLAFVRQLLQNFQVRKRFLPSVEIGVPPAVVLTTEVFDRFIDFNHLRDYALQEADDEAIEQRFMDSRFPEDIFDKLLSLLDLVNYPLAVRSSSLLEDSQYFPFTGVYQTYMVPNSHPDREVRVKELVHAIKRVYASTFLQRTKAYIRSTPYRLEEEKMAVILQRIVGAHHGQRFYPDFAGVARSYNYYPTAPMQPEDGVVCVALGFGQTVVEGGKAMSFSPVYPNHPIHFSTPAAILKNSQTEFFALDLEEPDSSPDPTAELKLTAYDLQAAQADATLAPMGSTYSAENDAVYDGTSRPGTPLVTFAPILKHDLFPLCEIARLLMDVGTMALNMPVEIEFAVNLATSEGAPSEFAFLQMRPFVTNLETSVAVGDRDEKTQLCYSTTVLGNGRISDLIDIVVVNRDAFARAESGKVAQIIAQFNARLVQQEIRYILVGVGRWGASDPWLGIPVTWEQIAGAAIIVESDFKDMAVTPSQGSHFFQNLTAAGAGYFTVNAKESPGFVDWDWLAQQTALHCEGPVRHLRLEQPVTVLMDGHHSRGAILKPGVPVDSDGGSGAS